MTNDLSINKQVYFSREFLGKAFLGGIIISVNDKVKVYDYNNKIIFNYSTRIFKKWLDFNLVFLKNATNKQLEKIKDIL